MMVGMESGWVSDGLLATSETQRLALWRLREEQPEGQRLEGLQSRMISLFHPPKIAEFVNLGEKFCCSILSGKRLNAFGHLGDGNIYFNLSPPAEKKDFSDCSDELAEGLAALANDMKGTFSVEHALGRAKVSLAERLRQLEERQLMLALKTAFDPDFRLNPDVIVVKDFLSIERIS
ncbi:hypothetical protein BA893_24170 [Vibrio natriegens]|uniref:FAD-binding oxidoreductase n=1 Tax=Vibrio natriegens TaxID=691 RepID=UPI00080431F5|nr:FAD-linked oxidase C-terminal domain-containing protein [Vibrio natriegens]ANQ24691.1 hypothetical protein BA893_24170 [Vibrio natriegens]